MGPGYGKVFGSIPIHLFYDTYAFVGICYIFPLNYI